MRKSKHEIVEILNEIKKQAILLKKCLYTLSYNDLIK